LKGTVKIATKARSHKEIKEKNETENRRGGEPEINIHRFTVSPPLRFNLLALESWG